MHLWGVSMVRNEGDIIDAFVRHNLCFLDGLVVLDHMSTDGTRPILQRLKAEGLNLVLVETRERAFFQASEITRIPAEVFRRTPADFVFALDADEFIRASSRAQIDASLAALPPGSHGRHRWYSYVPDAFDRPFGPHCLRHRLRVEKIPRYKAIIRRGFLETGRFMVNEGNHRVVDVEAGQPAAHEHIEPERLALAHCPVRSREQLERKAREGFPALREAGGKLDSGMAYHWRDLCEDVERGVPLPDSRLRLIAANYTVPRPEWTPQEALDLVEDPVLLCQSPRNRG